VNGAVPEVGLPKKLATGGSGAVVAVVAGTVVAVVLTVVLAAAAGMMILPKQKNPMQMSKKIRDVKNPSQNMISSLMSRDPGCIITTPTSGMFHVSPCRGNTIF
jgi:hypothetical protein